MLNICPAQHQSECTTAPNSQVKSRGILIMTWRYPNHVYSVSGGSLITAIFSMANLSRFPQSSTYLCVSG